MARPSHLRCAARSTRAHQEIRTPMKILLVDDDASLLEVTAFALRRAGFLVVLAHDGEQALRVWSDEQPDLIILDIQLPGKDGLTLCREIRALSNVPIILLTVR